MAGYIPVMPVMVDARKELTADDRISSVPRGTEHELQFVISNPGPHPVRLCYGTAALDPSAPKPALVVPAPANGETWGFAQFGPFRGQISDWYLILDTDAAEPDPQSCQVDLFVQLPAKR